MPTTIKTSANPATMVARRWVAAMVLTYAFLGMNAKSASAYTPEDPIVQKMIDGGISYLESLPADNSNENGGTTGLTGYAHFKVRHDAENPVVKRGIQWAVNYAKNLHGGNSHSHTANYEIAVAVLLLAAVDPVHYRPELETLQEYLMSVQLPNGPFDYPGEKSGDVSQTQYVMLAIWTLDRIGIPLEYDRVVACLQWLLRVQDIDGAWPYKGVDPGVGRPNIRQTQSVGYSMGLAGGSSILIAGDALRLWGDTGTDQDDPGIVGLPEAIKLFIEDSNQNRRQKVKISQEPVKRSINFLEQWLAKNPYKRGGMDWYYYIIYTTERYESFIEISQGSAKDPSPAWYNTIVEQLRGYQSPEGGWKDRSHSQPAQSTAFALLFLIRSTQKTIFSMSAGTLEGGYGLPKDTTNIRVDGTQIKGKAIASQVTDLLKILESDDTSETEGKSLPDDLELDPTPAGRRAQLDRLERLVRGSKSWQARRVAAKLLGKSDELRVAPALIFALSDPDKPTRRFARDGLRFISRKFEGFGMPDDPTETETDQAQDAWRAWYRTVDPTFVFLDYDL
ncbi:hypothetical protein [Rubripirellula reticaptiva]|uniref:Prenyltransferase and squalene oxidase repeat protein n=1 Tax=Rubripirellula reticaptiva TaxID=2528013 RepID=A0A5C6F753_9BACT|nr:hypothetical protein [Rubripirellula reticaptiva]TWU57218.1 hypothetical protein Poly59_01250 [Rubripirellula reticaptiva]